MTKAVQYFSAEYLAQCRKMKPEQIVEFIESFRELHLTNKTPTKSKLISIKIPEDLLAAFRVRSGLEGVAYQTQIKNLMREWLKK